MPASLMSIVDSIYFEYPAWLWGWLVSVLLCLLILRRGMLAPLTTWPGYIASRVYRHPRQKLLRQLQHRQDEKRATVAVFPTFLGYSLLLLLFQLALAHPYVHGHQLPAPPKYRDTVLIVDTSISMVLRDYQVADQRVERMAVLKSVLSTFIDGLQGNRISLVVFSEEAYTLVPLTADYALLKSRVQRLRPAVLTGNSTNIGKALIYTLKQLQRLEAKKVTDKPVLVLLTDVDRSRRDIDPVAVADYLHKNHFRLYTIGIGTSSYKAQENTSSDLIYQPTNFSLLEDIAEKGGGKFYWADSANSLQRAIGEIQMSERRKVSPEPRYTKDSLYHWPLLAAVLLLILLQTGAGVREKLHG